MAKVNLTVEEAQLLIRQSGTKIRARQVRATEYLWRCPDKRCPKHTLAGAIRGFTVNWVVVNAASHLKARDSKAAEQKRLKSQEGLVVGGVS